ncbi:MAG TPA: sulfotransferase [Rhodanobacteraceae bacterium]
MTPAEQAAAIAAAQAALKAGQATRAASLLAPVLAGQPQNTQALMLMGAAAQAQGDQQTAADCFARALPSRPADAALHIRLGIALHVTGRREQAAQVLRKACELAPRSALAWFDLGEALKGDAQHIGEARAAYARVLALAPRHVGARLALARIEAGLGDVVAAERGFREVLRLDPSNAWAWFGLSDLNVLHFSADDVAGMQHARARHGVDTREYNLLGFALAKALEDQGDYAQAFAVLKVANAHWRRHVGWDAAPEHARIKTVAVAAQDFTPPAPLDPSLGSEVIFIASLPRSGSTLLEHMLASHPRVEGANEIDDLRQVLADESRRRGGGPVQWMQQATAQDWQRLGRQYLQRTVRWRGVHPVMTDKNLDTWQWVNVALAMLPGAHVVIVHRDALETCLACFRQRFEQRSEFAYDLDDLAGRYADFMQLARLWRELCPRRVFDLAYEDLVRAPEPVLRRLLAFCGLPFDAACLDFQHARRSVMSGPSAAQVRAPLNPNTGRAARYGALLEPLRRRLRELGVA